MEELDQRVGIGTTEVTDGFRQLPFITYVRTMLVVGKHKVKEMGVLYVMRREEVIHRYWCSTMQR